MKDEKFEVLNDIINELEHTKIDDLKYENTTEAYGIGKGINYAIDIIKQKIQEI